MKGGDYSRSCNLCEQYVLLPGTSGQLMPVMLRRCVIGS